jgi:hypothetical protein
MRKYNFFVDLDKEERWLNELAGQGHLLSGKLGISYRFESGEPGSAVFRIDYRMFKRAADFEDYRMLFEDSGWQHIKGTKSSGAQYFRKRTTDLNEDIFSDADSKAGRFKRLSEMWQSIATSYIPIFVALLLTDVIDPSVLLHPADLYYTPGLWDKSGSDFWSSFLFETPFAFFRGAVWLIFPVAIVLAIIFSVKSRMQYNSTMSKS